MNSALVFVGRLVFNEPMLQHGTIIIAAPGTMLHTHTHAVVSFVLHHCGGAGWHDQSFFICRTGIHFI